MGKVLLCFLVAGLPLWGAGQIYLGYTEKDIEGAMTNSRIAERDVYGDGTVCLTVLFKEKSHYVRRYYFDARTDLCFLYILQPVDRDALNEFVSYCNEHYVTLGARKWRTYLNGLAIDVTLEYVESAAVNVFYFAPAQEGQKSRVQNFFFWPYCAILPITRACA